MEMRFTRLGSSNVLFQAHAAEDSAYVLLPVLERDVAIKGWRIYDTVSGELIDRGPGVPHDGVWDVLHEAREWLNVHIYRPKQQPGGH